MTTTYLKSFNLQSTYLVINMYCSTVNTIVYLKFTPLDGSATYKVGFPISTTSIIASIPPTSLKSNVMYMIQMYADESLSTLSNSYNAWFMMDTAYTYCASFCQYSNTNAYYCFSYKSGSSLIGMITYGSNILVNANLTYTGAAGISIAYNSSNLYALTMKTSSGTVLLSGICYSSASTPPVASSLTLSSTTDTNAVFTVSFSSLGTNIITFRISCGTQYVYFTVSSVVTISFLTANTTYTAQIQYSYTGDPSTYFTLASPTITFTTAKSVPTISGTPTISSDYTSISVKAVVSAYTDTTVSGLAWFVYDNSSLSSYVTGNIFTSSVSCVIPSLYAGTTYYLVPKYTTMSSPSISSGTWVTIPVPNGYLTYTTSAIDQASVSASINYVALFQASFACTFSESFLSSGIKYSFSLTTQPSTWITCTSTKVIYTLPSLSTQTSYVIYMFIDALHPSNQIYTSFQFTTLQRPSLIAKIDSTSIHITFQNPVNYPIKNASLSLKMIEQNIVSSVNSNLNELYIYNLNPKSVYTLQFIETYS